MANNNANLHKARNEKNDEFYTQYEDIEKELVYYKEYFKNKIILCNCDNPDKSQFWKYFHLNFAKLGLKKLISTHYDREKATYKMEYTGGDDDNIKIGVKTQLKDNGDFRNQECIDLLNKCDIITTNPPFSLAREYVACLIEHQKDFLCIGNMNWITYKNVFPLLMNNKIWLGNCAVKDFIQPDGTVKKFGNNLWFTNLDHQKRHQMLNFDKYYIPERYPKYDNYDAININKISDIPCDYNGIMGVPITFLNKYNPEQFEILGITLGNTVDYPMINLYTNAIQHNKDGSVQGGNKINTRATLLVKKKPVDTVYYTADNVDGYLLVVYPRILIKRKNNTFDKPIFSDKENV